MRGFVAKSAELQDLSVISYIHAYCWRETYQFMPEEVLDNRCEVYRRNQWESWFDEPSPSEALFKIVSDDKIVGFCFCKENDDTDLPEANGEVHALYMMPDYRGEGVGSLLILTLSKFLRERNLCPISLWAFKQNRALRWYNRLGFKQVVARNRIICGHPLPEFGYIHRDVDQLIDHLENLINQ